jgi:hypothetical protein
MQKSLFVLAMVILFSVNCLAAPSKKEALAIIKETESALKASDKVIKSGGMMDLNRHSKWFLDIYSRSEKLFVPFIDYGACSSATRNAGQIWRNKLEYSQRPSKMAYDGIERSTKYYKEDMQQCKEAIVKLK